MGSNDLKANVLNIYSSLKTMIQMISKVNFHYYDSRTGILPICLLIW